MTGMGTTVFVTGATGTLGRPVVERLLATGRRVRAISRSAANEARLRSLGAEPIGVDLFDPRALRAALDGCDAALHLATHIAPMWVSGWRGAWRENDRVRADGMRSLAQAARDAGVGVIVYPSYAFVYPDSGSEWIDAATRAVAPDLPVILRSTLEAEAQVQRFAAAGGRGVVLRMGGFYGPAAPSAREMLGFAARYGVLPLPGRAQEYVPAVWLDDAAEAVIAALDRAPAGVYDVVDDEPLTRAEFADEIGRAVGRSHVRLIPPLVTRLLAPAVSGVFEGSRRVSNRRFKEATGWRPTVPNARDGLARLAHARVGSGADRPAGVGPGSRAA